MEQPPGFVVQEEISRVCRFRKSLYRLKQTPRTWFGKFSQVIEKFGMQKSKSDHSVFYRNSEAGIILLVVYVDDFFFFFLIGKKQVSIINKPKRQTRSLQGVNKGKTQA